MEKFLIVRKTRQNAPKYTLVSTKTEAGGWLRNDIKNDDNGPDDKQHAIMPPDGPRLLQLDICDLNKKKLPRWHR